MMKKLKMLKNYILKRVYPFFKKYSQKDRFIDRYKDFIIKNNKLIFKFLVLEVIPTNKRDKSLTNFYHNFKAIGAGKINFYKNVTYNYINIYHKYCNNLFK